MIRESNLSQLSMEQAKEKANKDCTYRCNQLNRMERLIDKQIQHDALNTQYVNQRDKWKLQIQALKKREIDLAFYLNDLLLVYQADLTTKHNNLWSNFSEIKQKIFTSQIINKLNKLRQIFKI